MKSTIKKIFHPVSKEFQIAKCGFEHNPADDFIRSQWQKETKSVIFLVYRWLIALFFLVILLITMAKGWMAGRFFIYFTNWGLIMCTITNIYGGILLALWYYFPKYSDKLNSFTFDKPTPVSFKIYWGLHTTTLTVSLVITIIYWIFLFPLTIELIPMSALNVFAHAFNSIFMIADIIVVAFPVRILHVFLPIIFTLIFLFFSIIYYKLGGTDIHGNHFIYPILDWNKTGQALGTSGLVLVLFGIIAFTIFSIYKIRVNIHRKIYSRTKIDLPPPTTQSSYFERTANMYNGQDDQSIHYVPTTSL